MVGDACTIVEAGLARNGAMRRWCTAHQRGIPSGADSCGGAKPAWTPEEVLELDLSEYKGGVAMWGSVGAVYDTTSLPPERGVHVHARSKEGTSKVIDDSFSAVRFNYQRDLLEVGTSLITERDAVGFYISRFLGRELTCEFCTHCGAPHLDEGQFAVAPHRKHLCHACGRYFHADKRGISNPLVLLTSELEQTVPHHEPEKSQKALEIDQADFSLGMQLWASNPAIVWLADRPEESGIHVHAYTGDGKREIDETYGEVTVDGVVIDPDQVGYLMAQQAVGFLKGKIVSGDCPNCGTPLFTQGDEAFAPAMSHTCGSCEHSIVRPGRARPVVYNPLVATLDSLKAAAPGRAHEGLYLHHGHGH